MARNYRLEYDTYAGKPEQIKRRSKRNSARRIMVNSLGKSAVIGKDVDHLNGSPLDNARKNLRLTTPSKNRKKK